MWLCGLIIGYPRVRESAMSRPAVCAWEALGPSKCGLCKLYEVGSKGGTWEYYKVILHVSTITPGMEVAIRLFCASRAGAARPPTTTGKVQRGQVGG